MPELAVILAGLGNAAFLVFALLASAVGSLLLWLRHRRPRTFMSSIDEFSREMHALGTQPDQRSHRRAARSRRDDGTDPDPDPDLSGRR